MAKKTIEEQLKELAEQEKVLKARKQQLIAKSREQERKVRTHRLIEVGAVVEKALGRAIEKDELLKLSDFLYNHNQDFVNAMNRDKKI